MTIDGGAIEAIDTEAARARAEKEANLWLCIPEAGRRFGKLILDQWGYTVPENPPRNVVLFEFFRDPMDDPRKAAACALLEFVNSHEPLPHGPQYLGTVDVTEDYVNSRMAPHN